jgi:hypothetical protein
MAEYEKKVRQILRDMTVILCGMEKAITIYGIAPSPVKIFRWTGRYGSGMWPTVL